MHALRYLTAYTVPLSAFIGLYFGGFWIWLTPIYVFLLIPVGEFIIGPNSFNLSAEEEEIAKKSLVYSLILWFFVPAQWLLTGFLLLQSFHLSGWFLFGAILSTAISNGGIGITIAHELIHRKARWERILGNLLLLPCLYMHFSIEHVRGHHVHVATEEDPATARRGESFYWFWIRTVPQQWLSAWHLESERLQKLKLRSFSYRNQMIWFTLIQVGMICGLGIFAGWTVAGIFLMCAVLSFSLLEAVNYLEHYGLERQKLPNGRFEKVNPEHSWNSDHVLSRVFLFELTRHSDHHATASRKYQVLRSFEESPQLPTGYPGMILLALLPPLWYKVMHPMIDKWRAA